MWKIFQGLYNVAFILFRVPKQLNISRFDKFLKQQAQNYLYIWWGHFPPIGELTCFDAMHLQLRKTVRLVLVAQKFCQYHLMFKQYKLDERVRALYYIPLF